MAVIIADSNNSSFDGNSATTNGFYRVEAHNLIPANSTVITLTTTGLSYPVTFANAGNSLGVGYWFNYQSIGNITKDTTIHLMEKINTCTITIASPGVVTCSSHGLTGGEVITFTTTGALPTGIIAGRQYYVNYINANTFNISLTSGGANINTSGTQSGTHTLYVSKRNATQTPTQMLGGAHTYTAAIDLIVPFEWTGYAVTTDANKYLFMIVLSSSGSNTWRLETSDATNPCFFAWCDNKVSFTDNDTLVVKNKLRINQSMTLGGVAGTGYTTNGACLVVCRTDSDAYPDNVCNLLWEATPSASYTLTLKGHVFLSARGGWRIGTEASPIPIAQQAIIVWGAATVGTGLGISGYRLAADQGYGSRQSLFWYGEVPTVRKTTLNTDAALGATSFTTTDSTGWVNGDEIIVSKYDFAGQGSSTPVRTVSSTSGTTVNLTATLANYDRKAGGQVIKYNGYGIIFSNTANMEQRHRNPANFVMRGVCRTSRTANYNEILSVTPSSMANISVNAEDDYACEQWQFMDNAWIGINNQSLFSSITMAPPKGFRFENNYFGVARLFFPAIYSSTKSGYTYIKNNIWQCGSTTSSINWNNSAKNTEFSGNIVENFGNESYFAGNDIIFKNNTFWGSSATAGAIRFNALLNSHQLSGNKFNKMVSALGFGSSYVINCVMENNIFGDEAANTYDVKFDLGGGYIDLQIDSPTGDVSLDTTYLGDMLDGTQIRISDNNDTANTDITYAPAGIFTRCGTGLTDTTNHSSGFSLRFQPTDVNNAIYYDITVPTGNIATYQMTIKIWVKINSATYYAGTHQKPKMTIDYDNGTIASATATNTTDWQELSVSFTPTTSFGNVYIRIDGYTDATSTDSYFYIDDMTIQFPSGYAVNLGKFDVWSKSFPITPTSDNTGALSWRWEDDPYVVDTEAEANAFTGISLNYTTKVINITEDHSLTEIYEYAKASSRTNGVLLALSTKDGITYTLSGGWTLTLGENVDITGTQTINLSGTTLIFDSTNSMTPVLYNGTLELSTAGTVTCNMNGITIDYKGAGTFNHAGSSVLGTVTVTTSNDSTVTAQFSFGTTITNSKPLYITVENSQAVTLQVNDIVDGSRIQVYNLDDDVEMYNEIVSGTSWTKSITYSSDINVRIRLMYVNGLNAYSWYTATATITVSGFNVNAAQVVNSVYEANNIDGSTVTECSVSGTTIRIYVDDPDNTTTAQRIYNWYQYYLFTEAGIREQNGSYVSATDQTHYIFDDSMKIVNSDTSNPLEITGANIVPTSGKSTNIFDLSNGASIALNFTRVEGFAYSTVTNNYQDTLISYEI